MLLGEPGVLGTSAVVALVASAILFARRQREIKSSGTSAQRASNSRRAELLRRLISLEPRSPEETLAVLADCLTALVPVIDGLVLFALEGEELVARWVGGSRLAAFRSTHYAALGETFLALLFAANRRTVCTLNVPGLDPRDRWWMAVPLREGDREHVLVYAAALRPVSADIVDELELLIVLGARMYAVALSRERERARADFDGLTGLLTPRAFRARLIEQLSAACGEVRVAVAVLFIDTDYFKAWNDRFGHQVGDTILRMLAGVLARAANEPGDFAGRNGGDEFCLVFTACEKSRALVRAERVRVAIGALTAQIPVSHNEADAPPLSASIGVAVYPADASDASELLARADAAMYHVKRTGRNGVAYATRQGTFIRLNIEADAA